MRRILGVFLVSALAACSSSPQRGPSRADAYYSDLAAANAACDAVNSKPKYSAFSRNLAGGSVTEMVLMASKDRVTEDQRPLFAEWAAEKDDCLERLGRVASAHLAPPFSVIREANRSAFNALRASLYNGDITWGEYHQRGQVINADSNRAVSQVQQALAAQQYQAAIAAQNAYVNSLALPSIPPFRPVTTCNTIPMPGGRTQTQCR